MSQERNIWIILGWIVVYTIGQMICNIYWPDPKKIAPKPRPTNDDWILGIPPRR